MLQVLHGTNTASSQRRHLLTAGFHWIVSHLSMGTIVHKLVCVYWLLCGNCDMLPFGVGVGCVSVDNGHRVYRAAKVQRDLGECTGQTASA